MRQAKLLAGVQKEENKAIQKSRGKTRNPKCRGRRDRCPKDRQDPVFIY